MKRDETWIGRIQEIILFRESKITKEKRQDWGEHMREQRQWKTEKWTQDKNGERTKQNPLALFHLCTLWLYYLFKTKKIYHVTTILQTLQEPLVDFRMKFKFCTTVCLALLAFTLASFKFSPSLTQPHWSSFIYILPQLQTWFSRTSHSWVSTYRHKKALCPSNH